MSQAALQQLKHHFGDAVLETHAFRGDETATVSAEAIEAICRWLKEHPTFKFDMLCDMTAVDYLPRSPRFEVVYHLYSVPTGQRIRLKAPLDGEPPSIQTLCGLWPLANWLEREIWDMYGIHFVGHPNLKRILLYDEFVGHPLRKDYPKEKRQPLIRRPGSEIAEALAKRGNAVTLTVES